MYIQNYFATAGLSILFLVGCLIHLSENDVFSLETIRKFKRLIYVLMVEIVIDFLFTILEGHEIDHFMLYSLKNIELFLNPVLSFLVFSVFYARDRKWRSDKQASLMNRTCNVMIFLIIIVGLLLLVSVFGWNVFTIDEMHKYRRDALMPVYLVVLIASVVSFVYGLFLIADNTQSSLNKTLFFFAGCLIVGIGLRSVLPDTNYDFLCMAVSVVFLLVYYSHVTLRLDPLTKLLNRQVYMRLLERVNYTTIILMIDANNFKHINDTYGHECGDRTLKKFAKLICQAYGKHAYCFRIGGDEFCVILKPGAFDELIEAIPHYDAYALIRGLRDRLDELVAQQKNSKDDRIHLEYGVSHGGGVFYQPDTHLTISDKERKSFREVVLIADENMYKAKEEFRRQLAESSGTDLID